MRLWRAPSRHCKKCHGLGIQPGLASVAIICEQQQQHARTETLLRKTVEAWSQRFGPGLSIPTLMDEFARIQSIDVILPTTAATQSASATPCVPTRPNRSSSSIWA